MSDDTAARRRALRARWDEVARGIPDVYAADSTQHYRQVEIALLRRAFGDLRGKRVLKLDLWNEAVNTRILNWMEEQGAEVFGIDVSAVTAGRARENGRGRLRLVQADIRELPFADGSFDLLYTMGTIEHIDEYQRAVDEVARVLRPGGRAIVGVPHKWDIFLRPVLVRLLELAGKYAYAPEKSFSAGELRRVVEASGLRVTARTGILALPGIVRMADLFLFRRQSPLHRLTPLVLWPFAWAETRWRWPGYFGYLLALVVEKPGRAAVRPRPEVRARPRAAATP